MARRKHRHLLLAVGLAIASPAAAAGGGDQENLAPFKMLRSLQFVQDAVALGDASAGEMQRFLLGTIDQRLRTVESSVFDDDRNIDAALIYAMSGGNPATLEYLIARDVNGYFDNRVTDVLRKYLTGKGVLVAKSLVDVANEYQGKKIGPYLDLVAGNVMMAQNPAEALRLYDQARLALPGTIVEEAALRRSVAISLHAGLVDKGLGYSQRYVRRFLHSPYASQFADLFVKLAIEHNEVKAEDIVAILSFMDEPRRREVYLRIARAAGIAGKAELAKTAATYAQSLAGTADNPLGAVADFYGSMASVSTADVDAAAKSISRVADSELSPRDRALRAAAQAIAEQVLQEPDVASLTQASKSKPPNEEKTSEQAAASAGDGFPPAPQAAPSEPVDDGAAASPVSGSTEGQQDADPAFTSFMTTSRAKLDEIDGLLSKEGN
jgi:chemotaxis protein MotC